MALDQTVNQLPSIFSLRQQNLDCYYIGVTHSFPTDAPTSQHTPMHALPQFNNDQAYFTPSFILTSDQDYYRLNFEFERQKFQQKIQQVQFELSNSVMQAIHPSPSFCQICRQSYQHYSTHIQERSHGCAVAKTKGNKWILQACLSFTRKEKQIKKEGRGRGSKTQSGGMPRVKKKDMISCNESSLLSRTSNPSVQQHFYCQ